MKHYTFLLIIIQFLILNASAQNNNVENSQCIAVDSVAFPELYYYPGISNVYILKSGNHALLIDLGDASVVNYLPEIGIDSIDWILFTHHHREQCQGYHKLKTSNTKIAAPENERDLFEKPTSFRKEETSLGDPFTVYGASYVRPPVEPIYIDREFAIMDTFTWRGYLIQCIETPGDSPGSMTYLINKDDNWFAFSGDVVLNNARSHHFYDSQCDYGFGKGLRALHNSAALIRDYQPLLVLPSHGSIIRDPEVVLNTYLEKLQSTEQLLLRGFDVLTYSSATQDKVSKPTEIPFLWQVSPHIFKFKGVNYSPNFTLILSNSGHALIVDCGIVDTVLLQNTLNSMKEVYGLKKIDALIITHMHGDHFLNAPFLKRKWNVPVWTLESIAPLMEYPLQFDFSAMLPAYGRDFKSVKVDKTFKSGDTFKWEEYEFTLDWMPGQTKYALCMHGNIDSKKVAFTGDNIFADPDNPNQDGHEGLIAHNDATLEEGYIYAAEYLHKLQPDIIFGGHSYVMNNPSKLIDRYRKWGYDMREALQSLSPDSDYRYWFDPYWVHAEPYRIKIKQGEAGEFMLSVRNFLQDKQKHLVKIHTPPGITSSPTVLAGVLSSEKQDKWPVSLKVDNTCPVGVYIISFDITIDGDAKGELFDAILIVE